MFRRHCICAAWILVAALPVGSFADGSAGQPTTAVPPQAHFEFGGVLGRRIDANVEGWLIRAPLSNPGLLAMFDQRDRQPPPNLVPWAGEFVGKYLISAVQAMRMSDDPRLKRTVAAVVDRLLACQAEDGYLGPFPQSQRLLGNWDLWGHYHVMLGLVMWYDHTGDRRAYDAALKAADLVCRAYLDSGRRIHQAGSHEMNMAIVHVLGVLYRRTKEDRYLAMMRQIEEDWQKAGDYHRAGLAGVEFYRSPLPRWESLHDLQGLPELFRITGDEDYRRSFLHHWHSIRRFDVHNAGSFSSGEQATGHPYAPGAIETCCTIAWMAISIDALMLTGDSTIADELERATFNAVAGAQHPSGSWWTYNTPMDGTREASAHSIVFQARAGTSELNCCSVNGPRGLGMLSEWAVQLAGQNGLVINYYGPMTAKLTLGDGTPIVVKQRTAYPLDGHIDLTLEFDKPREMEVWLRIPGWAGGTRVRAAGRAVGEAKPGEYLKINRKWSPGDAIVIDFAVPVRMEAGDEEAFGKVSIYGGPLLLAYDQRFNSFDEDQIPIIDPSIFKNAKVRMPPAGSHEAAGETAPWLLVELRVGGKTLVLCDYASAGVQGTRYRSWLAADSLPPPPPAPLYPPDGARVPTGVLVFAWRPPADADRPSRKHWVLVYGTRGEIVAQFGDATGDHVVVPAIDSATLESGVTYNWKLVTTDAHGQTTSIGPPKRFTIDPTLPPLDLAELFGSGAREDGTLVAAPLAGTAKPGYAKLESADGIAAAAGVSGQADGAIALDGKSMAVYTLRQFPSENYSLAVWAKITADPPALGQIASAWCRGGDDPLRVCVQGGKLFARIEGGGAFSTSGVPIEQGQWRHVAAVKAAGKLILYLDGREVGRADVPAVVRSSSTRIALGGNPLNAGASEHLACHLADFHLFNRALTADEVQAIVKLTKGE